MPYLSNISVKQNLLDAGCDEETIRRFEEMKRAGNVKGQLKVLAEYRQKLLDCVHEKEKKISCLDYLVYELRKETEADERK